MDKSDKSRNADVGTRFHRLQNHFANAKKAAWNTFILNKKHIE